MTETKPEDQNWQHVINTLLSMFILIIASRIIALIFQDENYGRSIGLGPLMFLLGLFGSLLFFSARGHCLKISRLLPGILILMTAGLEYYWGTGSKIEILFLIITGTVCEICKNNHGAIFIGTTVLTLAIIDNYLEKLNIAPVEKLWHTGYLENFYIIILILIILTIIISARIFYEKRYRPKNKIIDQLPPLVRRFIDHLFCSGINRPTEISRVYHFAEMGQISSSLFHDLVNPLTAVSLNIEQIKEYSQKNPDFSNMQPQIDEVAASSEKMKKFVETAREQLNFQDNKAYFCLNEEIASTIRLLKHRALKNNVTVSFIAAKTWNLFGNATKFGKIIMNLLTNAIDAFDNSEMDPTLRKIKITLEDNDKFFIITTTDNGTGIPKNIAPHIFEPFFSTKGRADGLGLGLSLVKKIVEKDFSGRIEFLSQPQNKTSFLIILPKN
jgi:signal transduction histidine kinase